MFSYVQTEFLVLQFVPIAACPVIGHHWEEPGSILFTPFLEVLLNIDKMLPELAFHQAKQFLLS